MISAYPDVWRRSHPDTEGCYTVWEVGLCNAEPANKTSIERPVLISANWHRCLEETTLTQRSATLLERWVQKGNLLSSLIGAHPAVWRRKHPQLYCLR